MRRRRRGWRPPRGLVLAVVVVGLAVGVALLMGWLASSGALRLT